MPKSLVITTYTYIFIIYYTTINYQRHLNAKINKNAGRREEEMKVFIVVELP